MSIHPFISSFCDETNAGAFDNLLAGYTPCFTDIVILGVARVAMILLTLSRIIHVISNRHSTELVGVVATLKRHGYHHIQLILSVLCALIPLLQLNARLGGDEAANYYPLGPTVNGTSTTAIAPYEYVNFSTAIAGWGLVAVAFCLEMSSLPGLVSEDLEVNKDGSPVTGGMHRVDATGTANPNPTHCCAL